MKNGSRKLVLSRETLKPLTDDELGKANGGESYSYGDQSWSYNERSWSVSRSQGRSMSFSIPSLDFSGSYSGSRPPSK